MSKIAKLAYKLFAGQNIRFAEFKALLIAYGFDLQRTNGSHHIYRHDDVAAIINIQPDGKNAKRYQLRQFIAIVEEYGLKVDS